MSGSDAGFFKGGPNLGLHTKRGIQGDPALGPMYTSWVKRGGVSRSLPPPPHLDPHLHVGPNVLESWYIGQRRNTLLDNWIILLYLAWHAYQPYVYMFGIWTGQYRSWQKVYFMIISTGCGLDVGAESKWRDTFYLLYHLFTYYT